MLINWYNDRDALLKAAKQRIAKVDVILDIGCGIQPQELMVPQVHICCEPFSQYIDHLCQTIEQKTERKWYDRTYIFLKANWMDAVQLFPPHSVDTVFLLDVIEHLEKPSGKELLRVTENLIRRQLVLFTPLGFVPQEHQDGKDAWGLDGGNWQEHKSGWTPEDFDTSWEILGCKSFHQADNLGHPYTVPVGAFFALKTINLSPEKDLYTSQKVGLWLEKMIDRFPVGRQSLRNLKRHIGATVGKF